MTRSDKGDEATQEVRCGKINSPALHNYDTYVFCSKKYKSSNQDPCGFVGREFGARSVYGGVAA